MVNPITYSLLLAYDELLYLMVTLLSTSLELLSLAFLIFSQALFQRALALRLLRLELILSSSTSLLLLLASLADYIALLIVLCITYCGLLSQVLLLTFAFAKEEITRVL